MRRLNWQYGLLWTSTVAAYFTLIILAGRVIWS